MIQEILQTFQKKKYQSILICGATASGKSQLAIDIAKEMKNSLIINADSMQVYKEIPIITAQPHDMTNHNLYGFISCDDKSFSVAKWLLLASNLINNTIENGGIPIIVGGTGMYISSLCNGFSEIPDIPRQVVENLINELNCVGVEEMHRRLSMIDKDTAKKVIDSQRIIRALSVFEHSGKPISEWKKSNKKYVNANVMMKIFVQPNRNLLYDRINQRFLHMIENGVIEEVQKLVEKFPFINYPKAIGLKEIIAYIKQEITFETMINTSQKLTRNYAKRQETWFKNQILHYDLSFI